MYLAVHDSRKVCCKMKNSFLKCEKPLITAMVGCPTPDECIEKIKISIADGAEAVGVGLEWLGREYRTVKNIKRIFYKLG